MKPSTPREASVHREALQCRKTWYDVTVKGDYCVLSKNGDYYE